MIVTVTMNPAIDKTVDVKEMEHGGLNRVENVIIDAGGKGINVSKTIKELGGETIASGFLGDGGSEIIKNVLSAYEIPSDFVHVKGEVRTNLKVVEASGSVTELNEAGPVISEAELCQLMRKLEGYAGADTLFVMSGSIPRGVPHTIYRTLIEKVHAKGARVFLDADGELFANALEAKPDFIKPNRTELEEFYEMDYRANEEELVAMGTQFIGQGIGLVTITLGQMGALFLTKEQKIRCPGLDIKAHSTVGAGDAMVAALAYGFDRQLDFLECVKLGVATSAGAVTTHGTKPPTRELVGRLIQEVEIINVN